MFTPRTFITSLLVLIFVLAQSAPAWAQFQAGATATDITPRQLPVIVNGGFIERQTSHIDDPLHVRCLVVGDGTTKIAMAIADSCMIPRDVCDQVKREVERRTGIPVGNILIAATHTHSAPSLMDFCLGSRQDRGYTRYFVSQVIEGIVEANTKMEPAEAGWTVVDAPEHTHCRRWIRRPDRTGSDPFLLGFST